VYCLKLPTVNINRIVVKRDQSRFMQREAKMIPHKLSSNDIELIIRHTAHVRLSRILLLHLYIDI
jgi:hypothetical protein